MVGEDTEEKNPVNNNKEYNFKIFNFCHATTTNWLLIKISKADTGEKRTSQTNAARKPNIYLQKNETLPSFFCPTKTNK